MTRDCFEPASALTPGTSRAALGGGFEAETGVLDDAVGRFLADFDIEILRSVNRGVAQHHRSPTSAIEPAGQGSLSAFGARD
jgi:hypothetical protein